MGEFKFGVIGNKRKDLVTAISEILNVPKKYLGIPSYAFQVGDYHIDREGTVTGEFNHTLFIELETRGFVYEGSGTEDDITLEIEFKIEPTAEPEPTELAIEIPLNGFAPETIDNLCKMVTAKEPLIKKALGAEGLPIRQLGDRLSFPWFKLETDSESIKAYTQFITQLCKTAKQKKRVTAKAHESFENEKFAMRVWLIGLGMVGDDFKTARKLLLQNLSGNGAWRYGVPGREEALATEAGVSTEATPSEAATAPDMAADGSHEADAKVVA